jgi:hypothetical protein
VTATDYTAFLIGLVSVTAGLTIIIVVVTSRRIKFARHMSILWRGRETMSSSEYWAKCLLWSTLVCTAILIAGSLSGLCPAGEPEKHLSWYDDATFAAIGGLCWGLLIGSIIALASLSLRRHTG